VTDPPAGIVELALESLDLDAMVCFYEGLGLEVIGREPGRVWLRAGGDARLGIWSAGEKEHRDRGGMHVHFALAVSREALESAARQLGNTEGPVVHDGGDRSLYLFDPEGNRVELWDRLDPGGRRG
jgi:catechol-2,3-dioxygenase